MAFDFPNTPAEGATYTPPSGPQYIYRNGVWMQTTGGQSPVLTALPRNRIVNGAFQISQENGDTVGTTHLFCPADQWPMSLIGLTANLARSWSATEGGYRLYILPTAKPSLAAGDFIAFNQYIEGTRISDFLWGNPDAKQVMLRFDYYTSIAGTYCAAVRNSPITHSFLAPFTVPANAWTTVEIAIPGPTFGTWATGTGVGIQFCIVPACGSTYGSGVAGWQAANVLAVTGSTNGATTSTSSYIRRVGLYLDPENTGKAPPWEVPDEAEELRACQRYWQSVSSYLSAALNPGSSSMLPVVMRSTPAWARTGGSGTSGMISGNNIYFYQSVANSVAALVGFSVNARL